MTTQTAQTAPIPGKKKTGVMKMEATFFNEEGTLVTRRYDFIRADHKRKVESLVYWAIINKIELRIRPDSSN